MREFFHPIKWAIIGYILGAIVAHIYPAEKAFLIGLGVTIVSSAIGG
jgi:hypothetical protein